MIITQQVERKFELLLLFRFIAWLLCGLVFLRYYMVAEAGSSERQFMLVVLAFWTFFFIRFGRVYAWRKWGKENILIEDGMLSMKRSYGSLGKATGYILPNIKSFDILPKPKKGISKLFSEGYLTTGGERLVFTYFGKSVAFGKQLNDQETKKLHQIVAQGMKQFRG